MIDNATKRSRVRMRVSEHAHVAKNACASENASV